MVNVASVASSVPLSSIAPRVVTFTPVTLSASGLPLMRFASSRAMSTSMPSMLPVSGFWKPKPGTSIFVPTRSTSAPLAQPARPPVAPPSTSVAATSAEERMNVLLVIMAAPTGSSIGSS